jgi:hypothetical protein
VSPHPAARRDVRLRPFGSALTLARENITGPTPRSSGAPVEHPRHPYRFATWILYAVLTVVVWGLFAADRGLLQDDASALFWVRYQASRGPLAALLFTVTPTRLLANVSYGLAGYCPDPILALHLFYGAAWLGLGLLTHAIARELFPDRPRLPLVAGALTLCATADFLTNSPISLGYHVAACAMAASVWSGLLWLRLGRWPWAVAAAVFLTWSLWTYEAGLPSILLAPLLFWIADRFRWTRRLAVLAVLWVAVLLPWSFAFQRFLTEPGGYASRAVLKTTPRELFRYSVYLFRENFTPWTWLFERPVWFSTVERVLPLRLTVPLTLLALSVFLWAAAGRRRRNAPRERGTRGLARAGALLAWLEMATYASNAVFAGVISFDVFYRTHVFSKVWASILIALLGDWLSSALGRAERIGLVLPAVFVAFGAAAGLERQDYYLSSWRNHRIELASIVEQVPALRPGSSLVLYCPPYRPFKATEAEYLARAWLSLLEGDPTLHERVFLWSESRNAGCQAEVSGLHCWGEGQEPCFREGKCPGALVPFDKMVLLTFSPRTGRFEWNETVPEALLAPLAPKPVGYSPWEQVLRRPLEPWIERRLFGPPMGLARFLPVFKNDAARASGYSK